MEGIKMSGGRNNAPIHGCLTTGETAVMMSSIW